VGALWLLLIMDLALETVPLGKVCRILGISEETFYNVKQCGGLWRSDLWRLRQLEEENTKLKRLVTDLTRPPHDE
jgi:putative transposase